MEKKQGVKDNGVEAKIKELDAEIGRQEDAIYKLDSQKIQKEKGRAKLLDDRCDLLSRIIFVDLDELIESYLLLQEDYIVLRGKVSELAVAESAWYTRAAKQGRHPLYTTIADSFLRIDRMKGRTLGGFMDSLCPANESLKTESPFPTLRRDI